MSIENFGIALALIFGLSFCALPCLLVAGIWTDSDLIGNWIFTDVIVCLFSLIGCGIAKGIEDEEKRDK